MGLLPGLFLKNFSAVVIMMILVWGASLKMKNAGIVDIFWGFGFVVIAWISFFSTDGFALRKAALTLMTTLWGVRLAIHLFFRNVGQMEDRRYAAIRKRMGDGYWWKSLISIFGLQAVLLWIISIPVQVGQAYELPHHVLLTDILGMALWALGLLIESIADFQLKTFKANPQNRGKVMNKGLWRYSRHPNYFGESLVWWGIWCVAVAVPVGIFSVVSPVLITFLLLRVSGVRLMERNISERRPEYREYIQRTSAFIPWFPRKP